MRNFSILAFSLLGLSACRNDTGDDTHPDGNTNPDDVTIYQIQDDAMPACDPAMPSTCVELKIKGVVITAIDAYGNKSGDFWVQEPNGGPYSGVHVYGAPLDQVAALTIGDVVDIAGAQKSEFALSTDTSGDKLTELEPVMGGTLTVSKTGMKMPLQPQVVDALAIGKLSGFMARKAEWEKWEGVLVQANNVYATSSDACVGMACSDMTLHKFGITGDVLVESALAAMPMTAVKRDDCLGNVTGVVDYFFDYQILPRTTAEIATGGSACPPLENSDQLCGDGIDNDGNGFVDCMDFTCQASAATCSTSSSVSGVQMGTTMGAVTLNNVVITGRDEYGGTRGIWVADALQATQYTGVYVYMGSSMNPPANLVVGATVNVSGMVAEYDVTTPAVGDTLTEIKNATVTFVAAPTGTPVALTTVPITTLNDIGAAGEPYEGTLVQLSRLRVRIQRPLFCYPRQYQAARDGGPRASSSSTSASVKTRLRVRNLTPSGASAENPDPRPGTTSMIS